MSDGPTHDPRADDAPERRRFTIAHELGHWICQYRAGRLAPFYCRPGDVAAAADRAAEREANVFAAELLMPEPAVRAAWEREPEIAACAERFGVSGEAMHWRLYDLGLVEERPA
jgi:Zn-dependent peptidase ImmA (M78 family)